ncbi:MAG TPA: hypothetical protein DEB17_07670 [Chlorobaculum sp.]|uniref:Uncharacterized protein n=1 Tax=Chlorobaculum tepidum (strain ATCC 49652 / DSM 12025 / NBRC 103806 / TLS) TaxID=194439 RepID=Q8KFE8_CHLTE|nr:hypothetical protein CT0379 [Chlorobaculum tepidum TLS]HBU23851.1 hypothetical protein [Chlorobaculum sp.]
MLSINTQRTTHHNLTQEHSTQKLIISFNSSLTIIETMMLKLPCALFYFFSKNNFALSNPAAPHS